jgi:hypothetical protein
MSAHLPFPYCLKEGQGWVKKIERSKKKDRSETRLFSYIIY